MDLTRAVKEKNNNIVENFTIFRLLTLLKEVFCIRVGRDATSCWHVVLINLTNYDLQLYSFSLFTFFTFSLLQIFDGRLFLRWETFQNPDEWTLQQHFELLTHHGKTARDDVGACPYFRITQLIAEWHWNCVRRKETSWRGKSCKYYNMEMKILIQCYFVVYFLFHRFSQIFSFLFKIIQRVCFVFNFTSFLIFFCFYCRLILPSSISNCVLFFVVSLLLLSGWFLFVGVKC